MLEGPQEYAVLTGQCTVRANHSLPNAYAWLFSLPHNHTLRRISQPIPILGTQSSNDPEPGYRFVTFAPLTRSPGHYQASVYSQGVVVLSLPDNIPPLERKIVFQVRMKQ